jgi:hypothetical protein
MAVPATTLSTAGHGLRRSFPPLPSTASLPPARRGQLRNGADPGHFLATPRCGAHTRAGGCCRQPAMRNGRCRLHGGLSTGPRTAEGRARCARARLKHGFYSPATRALIAEGRARLRRVRALFGTRVSAGHGLLRSTSRASSTKADARSAPTVARAAATMPASLTRSSPQHPSRVHPRSSAANSPSSAGHGLLRTVLTSRPGPRAAHLLAGTALRTACPAGHGLLPSFSTVRPVPAGMMVQPALQFVAAGVR